MFKYYIYGIHVRKFILDLAHRLYSDRYLSSLSANASLTAALITRNTEHIDTLA